MYMCEKHLDAPALKEIKANKVQTDYLKSR